MAAISTLFLQSKSLKTIVVLGVLCFCFITIDAGIDDQFPKCERVYGILFNNSVKNFKKIVGEKNESCLNETSRGSSLENSDPTKRLNESCAEYKDLLEIELQVDEHNQSMRDSFIEEACFNNSQDIGFSGFVNTLPLATTRLMILACTTMDYYTHKIRAFLQGKMNTTFDTEYEEKFKLMLKKLYEGKLQTVSVTSKLYGDKCQNITEEVIN